MTNSAHSSKFNFSELEAKPMNRQFFSVRILLVVFAMLSLIVLNAGIAQGQAISGNLTGIVTDASGAAVNGATVEAVNLGTGQRLSATTRGSGEYVFIEFARRNLSDYGYILQFPDHDFRKRSGGIEQDPHRKCAIAGWYQCDHGRSFRGCPACGHDDGPAADQL